MVRLSLITALCLSIEWLAAALPAHAQAQSTLGGCRSSQLQYLIFQTLTETHFKLDGTAEIPVQVDCDDVQFFADHMEIFRDTNRVLASGHVVFVSGNNRISAERMDFNTQTRTGTFYIASGTATLGDRVERSMFGTQEPDAYFWGEELQKLGPKKYRITRGGFTACVQPTPRWELITGTATINLDDYALMKNAVFKVKNVPLMYMPIFYYPIQEDDRATGFMMPIYGNSTYRGQTLTNQFFWAISRSQDATFMHDWFTKVGHGYGGEYRYIAGPGSDGTGTVYITNERAATFTVNGQTRTTEPRKTYQIRGGVRQALPLNTRLQATADYFSDVTVPQQYQQNVYESTLRTRRWGVSTSSSWAGFNLTGTFGRDEVFYGDADSVVIGTRPRISFSRSATRIGRTPIYLQGGIDAGDFQREHISGTSVQDNSLRRVDGGGGIRVPFPTFAFLTVNSSLNWRGTWYSRSQTENNVIIDEPIFRDYFDMRTEVTGPTFVRIWNRPTSTAAERIKHLIEPRIEFRRLTFVDEFPRIFKYEGSDYVIGGSLETNYGVSTRVLIKPAGASAVSRDLFSVSVHQTHYGNPDASAFDPRYSTSYGGRPPNAFSPVSFNATVNPVVGSAINLRLEYDPEISGLQSISMGGALQKHTVNVRADYSRRRLRSSLLAPFDRSSDDFLSASTNLRTTRNNVGGNYSFHYDIGKSRLIQQRILGYYNAQCCGVTLEFQTYNFPSFSRFVIPQDRRFNISFTLAGIGTFSNFLGALSGQPDRR